jgi:hypothetical protein
VLLPTDSSYELVTRMQLELREEMARRRLAARLQRESARRRPRPAGSGRLSWITRQLRAALLTRP